MYIHQDQDVGYEMSGMPSYPHNQDMMMMMENMQERDMLRDQHSDQSGFPIMRSRSAMGMQANNKNYTFGNDRLHNIGRENMNLLGRIQRIADKGSNATGAKAGGASSRRVSSQTINRRRKEMEIARENQRIAHRLTNAKPVAFDKMRIKEEQALQVKYLKNTSQYPTQEPRTYQAPTVRKKASSAGRPPWFRELSHKPMPERPEWQD
mmetsp:Transcript_573/g.1073  ORF Transcript_573/g.1073 Transcript_573/m.1073 type:complete len:208 (+) Transcript_573:49-672(+)